MRAHTAADSNWTLFAKAPAWPSDGLTHRKTLLAASSPTDAPGALPGPFLDLVRSAPQQALPDRLCELASSDQMERLLNHRRQAEHLTAVGPARGPIRKEDDAHACAWGARSRSTQAGIRRSAWSVRYRWKHRRTAQRSWARPWAGLLGVGTRERSSTPHGPPSGCPPPCKTPWAGAVRPS